jgi:hypothetical protein
VRTVLVLASTLLASPLAAVAATALAPIELVYADWLDANYAVETLEAGALAAIDRRGLGAWRERRSAVRRALDAGLARLDDAALDATERRAFAHIGRSLADEASAPGAATAGKSAARCATADSPDLDRQALSAALYACFEQIGNHIAFEGGTIARATALELLHELEEPARRRALFAALMPLWARINATDAADSPYRRLIRATAREHQQRGASPISDAARTVGATPAQIERWLIEVLERWRSINEGPSLEPWDYWHHYAAGSRSLDPLVPRESIAPLSARFYRDLGADLGRLGVLHDLDVRPGKAPLAYSDLVRIGRDQGGRWRPAIARVSANVEHGGLYVLNEIVHEDGHAVHYAAVRTRPAFFDLGDDLFAEAFADVSSWSVAEPAWQQRYLRRAADESDALRTLYAGVMLDVAWGLFELRMLRDPAADPNAEWSAITHRFLNVVPHPEWSWWALRVQLVDVPGYLINYGLGAVLTADLRGRVRDAIGPFDAGNPRWYPWISAELLRFGTSVDTAELLRTFLGRPVSLDALLAELARIRPLPPP